MTLTLAALAAFHASTAEAEKLHRVLWGEPPLRYQPFTAWTFPGHEGPR